MTKGVEQMHMQLSGHTTLQTLQSDYRLHPRPRHLSVLMNGTAAGLGHTMPSRARPCPQPYVWPPDSIGQEYLKFHLNRSKRLYGRMKVLHIPSACELPDIAHSSRLWPGLALHHPAFVLLCLLVRARICLLGIWQMFGAKCCCER